MDVTTRSTLMELYGQKADNMGAKEKERKNEIRLNEKKRIEREERHARGEYSDGKCFTFIMVLLLITITYYYYHYCYIMKMIITQPITNDND